MKWKPNLKNFRLLTPSDDQAPEITKWAAVTQISPSLLIKLDGETSALAAVPDTLVGGLAVNDRVRVLLTTNSNPFFRARRAIVLGKAGGFPRMGCTLRVNSAVSIPNGGTSTAVSWNVEDFDPNNMWSSGSTITIPAAGVWSMNFETEWASALGTGRAFMSIEDNTGAIYRLPLAGQSETFCAMSWTMPMSASQTITAKVFQTSGAAVNLNVARLHVYRVSV